MERCGVVGGVGFGLKNLANGGMDFSSVGASEVDEAESAGEEEEEFLSCGSLVLSIFSWVFFSSEDDDMSEICFSLSRLFFSFSTAASI